MVLEGLPWGDALYLAIITTSTVGYGDFVPLTPAGRAFAAGLIVTGVSIALYLFWVLGQHIVEGRLRELLQRTTMQRNIGETTDGYVDYVKGANIAGFVKVADAMMAYGVL